MQQRLDPTQVDAGAPAHQGAQLRHPDAEKRVALPVLSRAGLEEALQKGCTVPIFQTLQFAPDGINGERRARRNYRIGTHAWMETVWLNAGLV